MKKEISSETKRVIAIGAAVVVGGGLVFIAIKSRTELAKCLAQLENANERIVFLEELCNQKDNFFKEMISDGLRHGSSLAGKHMADRLAYLTRYVV